MATPDAQLDKQRFWEIPWLRGLLIIASVLLAAWGVYAGARQIRRYGQQKHEQNLAAVIAAGRMDLRIDFAPPRPTWIDPHLLREILKEAQLFAEKTVPPEQPGQPPVSNYFRLCNRLDDQVLGELAQVFIANRGKRQNAWIRQIRSVRRVGSSDGLRQTILIDALFRRPVAFVAQGNSYFLVDADGVLLPGEYHEEDLKAIHGLLVIRKVEESLPAEPGQTWISPGGKVAIRLAMLLADKPYIAQIAAINMENFDARMDPMGPQIKLDTVFQNPADPSRVTEIHWGRAPGDESFREVQLAAKLKALNELYLRFNRIDAGQSYVDIRTEQVRIPRTASGPTGSHDAADTAPADRHRPA